MANNTVDTDSLNYAAVALNSYINDVSADLQKMRDAAVDCHDNMGQDKLSQKAIEKLGDCISKMQKTLDFASELKRRILETKKRIEDVEKNF